MVAKPDSLEAKFKLMQLLPFDKRMKRKHILVYGFILDWFHSKYGDALASSRHVLAELKERDPFGQGLFMGDVHTALTDLVSWGYLSQEKGSGRKASRYIPIWSIFDSVRETQNATTCASSVLESPNASVRETPNATADSVRDSLNEDPLTVTRPPDGVTVKEGYDCAAPVAPPLAGLTAAKAVPAQEGFEELWTAYAFRQKKAEAKAAYAKLNPDPERHAATVLAASQWRMAWAAQGKADAPRYTLAKWIERQDFECDPPTVFKPKQRKSKPEMQIRPVAPIPANENGQPHAPRIMTIGGANVVRNDRKTSLAVTFFDDDGEVYQEYEIEHYDMKRQNDGQAEFGRLVEALQVGTIDDASQLTGLKLVVQRDRFKLTYSPVPAAVAA